MGYFCTTTKNNEQDPIGELNDHRIRKQTQSHKEGQRKKTKDGKRQTATSQEYFDSNTSLKLTGSIGKSSIIHDLPYSAPQRMWDKQWEAFIYGKAEAPGPHPDPEH